ncbi:hypothetical protein EW146_g9263 [Bondarzewia mesenterica]|uniref:Protein kinase domain-containing protein n=1 Tax=Bondarzewia mesenterica TaxID=1095465 RepID=A0A4S4LD32_9AGAM|nr:hypothetical protein EW146_g9263 [Bondarzewia mesenterica]
MSSTQSSGFSPRKPGVGIQNLSSTYDDTKTTRRAIKEELLGRVIYDDIKVFDRLHLKAVDDGFVDRCAESFRTTPAVQDAITALKELETSAEMALKRKANKEKGGASREELMYPYLSVLFDHIQRSRAAHSKLWRDRDAFVEIKATKMQGPRPDNSRETTIQDIVTQAADYARLYMSARPFVLFSFGLLIFGSEFCVGIFDRDGVTFSPKRDMWKNTNDFIRVIRSMACELTTVELGQDPTVYELDSSIAQHPVGQTDKNNYPSYVISPVGSDRRQWCTIGCPLWSSLSLFGRGTIVWHVREYANKRLSGPVQVLKTAWRSSKRDSEASIYQTVKGTHPGLAKYLVGGDVRDPRHLGLKEAPLITVRHIRLEAFDPSAVTPVLHRLIISTAGRPLWEYSSDLELLKGMRAVLDGHRFLYDQGILHRDISAGNILLAAHPLNAPQGHEGFITDLEFARVEGEILTAESTVEQVPSMINLNDSTVPMTRVRTQFTSAGAQRGAIMTGTLQFMATELLKAIKNKTPILQTVQHDIESFVWVLAFSTIRKLLSAKSSTVEHDELDRRIRASFGRLVVDEIWESRDSLMPLKFVSEEKLEKEFIPRFVSEPLTNLFGDLKEDMTLDSLAKDRRSRKTRRPGKTRLSAPSNSLVDSDQPLLTHSWLSDLLTDSIDWLEEDPALNR